MAVAFDAGTATVTNTSGTATLTISNLTVGSGSNRAVAVLIWWDQATVPGAISAVWDSGGTNQAMTLVSGTQAATGASTSCCSIYAVLAPTSGNKNLVITWTLTDGFKCHAAAISLTGVDQTSVAVAFPHGTNDLKVGSTASPVSITVTSAVGNMVIAMHQQSAALWGAISDTTLAADDHTGGFFAVAYNYVAGAASNTLTAAFSGSSTWGAAGCDVLAAPPAPFTGYVFTVGQDSNPPNTRMIGY